jgi:signal recognition particle receptor subunit beta
MVQINFAQKQVSAKIVYYGPGMSGKTTNLEIVHQRAPDPNKGELTSISTDGDRTLFFDFMPLDLGTVAGMRTCFQIYTVPGQVYYNSTRKLVLQGVDGVVFVADSSVAMMNENLESLRNLEENLNEYGKSLATMPHVIQFNKRDLPDAMSVDELNQHLNVHDAPFYKAIANTGQGVFPTLKALAAARPRRSVPRPRPRRASRRRRRPALPRPRCPRSSLSPRRNPRCSAPDSSSPRTPSRSRRPTRPRPTSSP